MAEPAPTLAVAWAALLNQDAGHPLDSFLPSVLPHLPPERRLTADFCPVRSGGAQLGGGGMTRPLLARLPVEFGAEVLR